jgi:beta-galactosidase
LLPHWNWAGKEGQEIRVDAFSNCKEVELFLNGDSLGRQSMKPQSKLTWQVKYAPGTLSAKGYDNDKVVAETKVETTGEPAKVQFTPDHSSINADGEDLSVITVSIADAQGRVVPSANNMVHFNLSGPGKIIGVGNGDPSCHEPDTYITQPALHSGTMNQWWMKTVSNSKEHREVAEKFNDTRWDLTDLSADAGRIGAGESAVYRAHLFVSDQDLSLNNISVRFGAIKDEASVYVNGKLAGESRDSAASPSFDVKKFLHAGVNTIAVLVKAGSNSGGISGGVTVEMQKEPMVPQWQRSTFNGLAQILVQSTKEPGQIQLTASVDGLSPATVAITSQPCTPRTAVP